MWRLRNLCLSSYFGAGSLGQSLNPSEPQGRFWTSTHLLCKLALILVATLSDCGEDETREPRKLLARSLVQDKLSAKDNSHLPSPELLQASCTHTHDWLWPSTSVTHSLCFFHDSCCFLPWISRIFIPVISLLSHIEHNWPHFTAGSFQHSSEDYVLVQILT